MQRTNRLALGSAVFALACSLGCAIHERSLQYDDDGGVAGAGGTAGTGGAGGTAGTGGADAGATCTSSATTSACGACVNTSCCSEFNACFNSTACQNLLACETDCTGSACSTCTTQNAAGVDPLTQLLSCTSLHCKTPCTSGDGGTSVGTVADAFLREASAICGTIRDCAPGLLSYLYGSYDECVARINLAGTFVASLSDTGLDVAKVDACAAAWAKIACSAYGTADPDACWVPGVRANGQGCNTGDQCASMFCKQQAWSCGTCAPMPGVGAACALSRDCGRGSWCASDGTCQKPRNLNESCSAALPCRNDLACYQGKCVVLPTSNGAACDATNGLYCDGAQAAVCATTNQCVPEIWVGPGQSCGMTTTQATRCIKQAPCVNNVCPAALSDSRTCDPANDTCEWPGICSPAKTCMMPSQAPVCPR